ncbi:MAG: hypothetical protein RL630_1341 [Verrucomicrobiota bacterium]|jgi:hypothetical protein
MKSLLLLLALCVTAHATEFSAYYTKVDSGEDFEKFSRTSDEADIVVQGVAGNSGRLVFSRATSYLPVWEAGKTRHPFKELTPRSGDGPATRPDNVNTYSVARIIESSPERVVIHWRYLPKFTPGNPNPTKTNLPYHPRTPEPGTELHLAAPDKFVDEYFIVTPDGKVERTFRAATPNREEWTDPQNLATYTLQLSSNGIKPLAEKSPVRSAAKPPVAGSPLVERTITPPVRWWKFNEGAGDTTAESLTGESSSIEGPMTYWRKGMSGTALGFDGYNTTVKVPASSVPIGANGVTVEAWVALAAYPWSWVPVVQLGEDENIYLGIDADGYVAFRIQSGGKSIRVRSGQSIERRRWYQLAGVYDKEAGRLRLYIDGRLAGDQAAPKEGIDQPTGSLQIGQGKPMSQAYNIREKFPSKYSLDGLIDEVRIYDTPLTTPQVAASCRINQLADGAPASPDIPPRVLPTGPKTGKFGAHFTHLDFYDTWDGLFRFGPHPDVVVEFDKNPSRFVFWRGMGFIPMLVNEKGHWYSNEFNETWNRSGGKGCMEPMSDKESFTNHVKILENTPARVVVQWRFPLIDVMRVKANYDEQTGWSDWSDWTYTIYPDGVAVKSMHLWSSGPYNHEFQEGMVIFGPDQHPEQVIKTNPALSLATLTGETRDYSWETGPPKGVNYRDTKIHVVNFKGDYSPFTIGEFTNGNVYSGEVTEVSVFPWWNHWPVGQMPSDGRNAKHPDRTSHCSLTHVFLPDHKKQDGDRPFRQRLLMEGMTNLKPAELVPLAKSWLKAPAIAAKSGCKALPYEPARREYPLIAEKDTMAVTIDASADHPVENLCLTVKNWGHSGDAKVSVTGAEVRDLRQGTVLDTEGRRKLIIWLEMKATSPVDISIEGAKPTAGS